MNETTVDRNAVPEIAPTFRFQWEEAQDCYVILYPEGMVKLSNSAGEIMKRVDGQTSINTLISNLQEIFPDASVEGDVLDFMEVAYGNGWIRNKP